MLNEFKNDDVNSKISHLERRIASYDLPLSLKKMQFLYDCKNNNIISILTFFLDNIDEKSNIIINVKNIFLLIIKCIFLNKKFDNKLLIKCVF